MDDFTISMEDYLLEGNTDKYDLLALKKVLVETAETLLSDNRVSTVEKAEPVKKGELSVVGKNFFILNNKLYFIIDSRVLYFDDFIQSALNELSQISTTGISELHIYIDTDSDGHIFYEYSFNNLIAWIKSYFNIQKTIGHFNSLSLTFTHFYILINEADELSFDNELSQITINLKSEHVVLPKVSWENVYLATMKKLVTLGIITQKEFDQATEKDDSIYLVKFLSFDDKPE